MRTYTYYILMCLAAALMVGGLCDIFEVIDKYRYYALGFIGGYFSCKLIIKSHSVQTYSQSPKSEPHIE